MNRSPGHQVAHADTAGGAVPVQCKAFHRLRFGTDTQQKQPLCVDRYTDKVWSTHTGDYYLAVKRSGLPRGWTLRSWGSLREADPQGRVACDSVYMKHLEHATHRQETGRRGLGERAGVAARGDGVPVWRMGKLWH